ncbi:MAG: flagellar hook-basal body protein [Lachnospiraceae bacterium]|nr:flagellar hook-basal body protein [Lachnospiraceae bacterium]
MVRSLWSGATGMLAQQTAVDTISNNIANVNTTGYKTSQNEFKSLLYQELQTKTTTANAEPKPIDSQVGLGVRSSSITTIFRQGAFLESASDSSFAIDGKGFFAVKRSDGSTAYTRNGDFHWATTTTGLALTDSDGNAVLDSQGREIKLNGDYTTSRITLSQEGDLCYPDEKNNPRSMGIKIGAWQFNNPAGLEKLSDSLYLVSDASGEAMNEFTNNNLDKSRVVQGYLEGSNVQLADEMVNLIVAQRAYEANSRVITTTDTMMQQANQLKQ